MRNAPFVLIVEDEYEVRALLAEVLEEHGYRLAVANEFSVGARILGATRPDLLITDVLLRGGDGERLAKLAQAMDVPVLFISGEPDVIDRLEGGPIPFLRKPFRLTALQREIEKLLPTKP